MASVADVDILIIGAGFAGLRAARSAARRGASVLVADAKPHVGARLHTTGIFVQEAAEYAELPDQHALAVPGVRLYGPSRRHVDLFADDYAFFTTDTGGVLAWMAQDARAAGAEVRTGARFEGGEVKGDHVVARLSGQAVRARWILGADGAKSDVAAAFDLGRNTRLLTGVEREYARAERLDARFLHCFIDSGTAPGYLAWVAPGPDVVQVGLAVSPGRKPDIDRFVAEAEALFGLDPASVVERRAGLIPCGGLVDPWARPRVTLIGDSAGMVSPLTGGGIHLALEVGEAAGEATAAHLSGNADAPDRQLAQLLPRLWPKLMLRRAADMAVFNPLIDLALDTPIFRAFARRVYFHRGGAGDPPPPQTWQPREAAPERQELHR